MSELGPNAHGELLGPGRVTDCYLGLPLPPDEDEDGMGGVLVVAPRWLLHPAVPSRPGSLIYELATGHPDRQPGELVFPADLAEELRAWPTDTWAALGVDLGQVAAAVVGYWQRGNVRGLYSLLEPGEDPRALLRPAMTLARGNCAPAWHVWSPEPGGGGCTRPADAGQAAASCRGGRPRTAPGPARRLPSAHAAAWPQFRRTSGHRTLPQPSGRPHADVAVTGLDTAVARRPRQPVRPTCGRPRLLRQAEVPPVFRGGASPRRSWST